MCTVTYLPDTGRGYILTSSRDEQTTRPSAQGPVCEKFSGYTLLFPKDPKGGGTWIATSSKRRSVCLFNGAFKAHIPRYPYRQSRGLIVLDFFKFDSIAKFSANYNFDNIEPFTLIVTNNRSLYEFKWDGINTYILKHDPGKPAIWSSATLYSPQIIELRESWFLDWRIKYPAAMQSEILNFHLSAGDGNKEYDILMERKTLSLKTVSITSLSVTKEKSTMMYLDLMNNTSSQKELLHM